jgi:hypothetical protein
MKKTESMEVERQRQDESKRDSEVEIEYRHEEEGSIYKFLGARQASVRGSSSIGGSSSIQSSRRSSSRSVAGLKAGCRNHAKKARRACLPAIDEKTRQPEKESAWLGSIRRKNVKGGKAYEEYARFLHDKCMRTIDNGEPSDGTTEENGIPSEIFIEVDDEGGGNEIKGSATGPTAWLDSVSRFSVRGDSDFSVTSSIAAVNPESQLQNLSIKLSRMTSMTTFQGER